MGKYAKFALVLLYLLQLVIVFREQLVHLYESALETRNPHALEMEAKHERGLRAVMERVVRIARPEPAIAVQAAVLSHAVHPLLEAAHEPHHEGHDDDGKDRVQKFKRQRAREFLIINLFALIRSLATSGSADEERSSFTHDVLFPKTAAALPIAA